MKLSAQLLKTPECDVVKIGGLMLEIEAMAQGQPQLHYEFETSPHKTLWGKGVEGELKDRRRKKNKQIKEGKKEKRIKTAPAQGLPAWVPVMLCAGAHRHPHTLCHCSWVGWMTETDDLTLPSLHPSLAHHALAPPPGRRAFFAHLLPVIFFRKQRLSNER